MKYYLRALKKYAVFKGRASRKEYWLSVLFYFVFLILAWGLDFFDCFGTRIKTNGIDTALGWIFLIYLTVTYLPFVAVSVRRLHDSGRTGWMFFVTSIPLVGCFWYFYLMAIKGTEGMNEYGDPSSE